MSPLYWILIFVVSIAVLVRATDYFIEGSETIGVYFGIKPFLIGVFVLGFGTSLPELVVGLFSVLEGASEVVIGNVVGSNIANILLVLGVGAIIVGRDRVDFDFLEFDLPLFISSAFFLTITAWNGVFTAVEGAFFLGLFMTYVIYSVINHKDSKLIPEEIEDVEEEVKKEGLKWPTILKIVVSPIVIYFSARYTVEATLAIAEIFDFGTEIIAVSGISIGTSVPELAVSFVALKQGKFDEMVGNIVGSNIFNTLVVMGIPALITDIIVPESIIKFALPMMLVSAAIAFILMEDKEIRRWEGVMLVLLYIFFIAQMFNLFCFYC